MSESPKFSPSHPLSALTPQQVITWLESHPDFLEQHPEACDALLPPAEKKGRGVADFQTYMVKRLKADREDVLTSTRELIETARTNMNNATRIHRAILRLLEVGSLAEFIETLTHDLSALLDVDITALVIEADAKSIPHIPIGGLRMVPEGTIDRWLQDKSLLLQSNISGIEAIYGGGATLVRSQALVRIIINPDTAPALLAFGSRDPQAFGDGQGTELVQFLTGVVERLFRFWLATAPRFA